MRGRTILLHAEQGLGDTLQFIRYVKMIREKGAARVVVLCPSQLGTLLAGQVGIDEVATDPASLPGFDVHCPLLSVPRVVGTMLETVPRSGPYIVADPVLKAHWHRRLAALAPARNVGIVWAGSAGHVNDRNRSMRLADFAPLAMEGCRFFSLQKGEPSAQARVPLPGLALVDWTDELGDLSQTAALIANLDLVISVDTAVAHLAGAMGKGVCVLLPHAPDWRWMWGREDSPWYPTMRLIRQPVRRDWGSVIQRVRGMLSSRDGTGEARMAKSE